MYIKNTGAKTIGIGGLAVLPDSVERLPDGYDKSHPTIKFLITKGFAKLVNSKEKESDEKTENKKATGSKKEGSKSDGNAAGNTAGNAAGSEGDAK